METDRSRALDASEQTGWNVSGEQKRRMQDSVGRMMLEFVKECFAFLVDQYGFSIGKQQYHNMFVYCEYRRDWLIVKIEFEFLDAELMVMVGDISGRTLLLSEILRERSPHTKVKYKPGLWQRSADFLLTRLPEHAALLKEYTSDILSGDRDAFRQLYMRHHDYWDILHR